MPVKKRSKKIHWVALFLGFLLFLIGGASAWNVYVKTVVRESRLDAALKQASTSEQSGPDLGVREFGEAKRLLLDGELVAARDRLRYLLEYFGDSQAADRAKALLTDINLDLVLSDIPTPEKVEYTVKSGDALSRIARNGETSIDYILRANGLLSPVIHPDQVLFLLPLGFRLELDLGNESLEVLDSQGNWFAEFPVAVGAMLPDFPASGTADLAQKSSILDDRVIGFDDPSYLDAEKVLRFSMPGLIIRSLSDDSRIPADGEASGEVGIFMDAVDMRELFTILRPGTALEWSS